MIKRTRIKVCGITRSADARQAVACGVDALGFIFAEKSKRCVDPDRAREIIAVLPPFVDAVGVFVDAEPDKVKKLVEYCGLTVLQLHGSESVEYCRSMEIRVVKAFAVRSGTGSAEIEPYAGVAAGYLFDTYHEKLAGGTGQTFDWSLIKKLTISRPLILAGGLNPENVGRAVREVGPFAIDLNSGVEISPGLKDHTLVEAAVREVMKVDEEINRGESETS